MGKSKPDQGQGEEFIAMVKPMVWSKGTGVEIVMDILLNCCNPLFQLHVIGITIAGPTRTNGGRALREAVQVQQ